MLPILAGSPAAARAFAAAGILDPATRKGPRFQGQPENRIADCENRPPALWRLSDPWRRRLDMLAIDPSRNLEL